MPNSPAIWLNYKLPQSLDIALLRPRNLPKGQRFETERDARKTAEKNIIPALRATMPSIAQKITDCVEGDEYCLLPICPACSRHYRRFRTGEFLRIYGLMPDGAQTATIYLETYEAGELRNASIHRAHESFRKKLQRSGFGAAILIGGTEVTYRQEPHDWLLHLHLLALNVPQQAWTNLEGMMRKSKVHDPLRCEPVSEPIDQLSYLQKFHTYHRPGKTRGKSRARPYPLKNNELGELASWACNYEFSDFTFCFGARRHHGRILCDRP